MDFDIFVELKKFSLFLFLRNHFYNVNEYENVDTQNVSENNSFLFKQYTVETEPEVTPLCTWCGPQLAPPGVLGIWGEWLFIFRELGSTGNYFRGAREHAHIFWGYREPCQKAKNNKEKPPFCLIF